METRIGVDLGGTSVRAAVVDEDGHILDLKKADTQADLGDDVIIQNITNLVSSLDGWRSAKSIGIAMPGILDLKKGEVLLANNLSALEGKPFAARISEILQKPVFLGNDVNAAALAEAVFGAGKGKDIVYYISISTGVGGAAILHQKIHAGKHGLAGEVCNLIVDPNREALNRLNPGALENECSGTALCRKAQEKLGKDKVKSTRDLFDLIRRSDPDALQVLDGFVEDLAVGMANIALVLDPDVFVLGGGVSNQKDLFFDKLKAAYDPLVFEQMRDVELMSAAIDEPGVLGAAVLPVEYGY